MSKPGVKFGICHYSLPMDGPCALEIAKEVGFDGVQLDIIKNYKNQYALAEKITQKKFMELGKKYGIEFPSVSVRQLDESTIFGEDNSVGVNAIKVAIEVARDMGAPIVLVPTFANSEIKSEENFSQAVEILSQACDLAADYGITIGTENVLPPDEIEKLLDEVARPNIKFYFDIQNHYIHKGYNSAKLLERLMPHVCEVHVKDGKNKDLSGALLGQGDAGFYQCVEVLKKHNYSGWIVTENYYDLKPLSLGNDDPVELMRMDLQTLKDTFR